MGQCWASKTNLILKLTTEPNLKLCTHNALVLLSKHTCVSRTRILNMVSAKGHHSMANIDVYKGS